MTKGGFKQPAGLLPCLGKQRMCRAVLLQVGLDDAHMPAFVAQQQQLSDLVEASGAMAAARALARRGVLPARRARLWHLALGMQPAVGAAEQQEFDELCRCAGAGRGSRAGLQPECARAASHRVPRCANHAWLRAHMSHMCS